MDNTNFTSATNNAGQAMPWYEVWSDVITHPSRNTFRRILADPTARPARAFIWVAVVGVIVGLLELVVYQVIGINPFKQFGGLGLLTNAICISVATPIFSIIGLAISAGIYRGIAALLKGAGNYNDMVYVMGAVSAPLGIVSAIISLISTTLSGGSNNIMGGGVLPVLSLCLLPFTLAIGIYAIVLDVLAVDTVENFGTGKATLTVLAPVILVLLLAACIVAFAAIFYVQQVGQ